MDMSKFLDIQAKLRKEALARSVDIPGLFAELDVRATAAAAGGMLTLRELQGNAVRMEAIVHFAVSSSLGRRTPRDRDAARWFREAGKAFGAMEDPAEDVFVARAMYGGRNYLVLGGTAEASNYHLQRMLDVLEEMPDFAEFGGLKRSCEALLRLSDAVCRRAGLDTHDQGDPDGCAVYPLGKLPTVKALGSRVTFALHELKMLGVHPDALSPFELDQKDRDVSIGLSGNTKLERRPLLRFEDAIVVALPSAIGLAIRFATIEFCRRTGNEEVLRSNMLATEIDVLSRLPSIYWIDIPRSSVEGGAKVISATPVEFQPGYWFQVIIVSDDFDAFDETGFYDVSPHGEVISQEIEEVLESTATAFRGKSGFKLGLSLVVICGCGRSIEFGFGGPDQWIVEPISAYDMQVLGWRSDFDISELFKFLLAENHAMQLGFPLMAVNGLLARAGFAFENDGHVVPHERMPDGLEAAALLLPTNAHLKLRMQHYQRLDWRTIVDPEGRPSIVHARSPDRNSSSASGGLYLSLEDARAGRLRTVWLNASRRWFAETVAPDGETSHLYPAFEMQMTWLERIAPVLDRYAAALPDVLTWKLVVPFVPPQREVIIVPSETDIHSSIEGACDPAASVVTITLDENFFHGLSNDENLSEKSLVSVFLEQVTKLAPNVVLSPLELLREIVPSKRARQLHAFAAQDLRDYVRDSVTKPLVQISRFDNAATRLGLGRHEGERRSGVIKGRSNCTETLNQITKAAEAAFCDALSSFERRSVIERTIENHEASVLDKRQWDRTSGSLIDMSLDHAKTQERIFDHTARANATAMACRIIMEAAICESPVGSGYQLADNDLSGLMAQAMMIHHLGGYSDAIHYEGMNPEIRITPAGDVHIDTDFFDSVVTPVGRTFAGLHLERNIRDYSGLLREPDLAPPDVNGLVEPEFLLAWEAELGISFSDFRLGLETLEDHFHDLGRAWASLKRPALIELLGQAIPDPQAFIAALELMPRDRWTEVPSPFDDQDRQPWRFRRRLSVVRRPLIRIESDDTSDIIIAPGIVRDAFSFLIHSFYHGEIDISSLTSQQMRDWRERVVARSSAEFEERVVKRLESMGWKAKRGVKFTTVLNRRLSKDPGDIDVLAWHPDGRVRLLECKDLQFAKTPSEIAKQLYKFRGVPDERGRPDLLGKHLNRISLAKEHAEAFGNHLKLSSVKIEGGLVFANPVPMNFAATRIGEEVPLMAFRDLEKHFA